MSEHPPKDDAPAAAPDAHGEAHGPPPGERPRWLDQRRNVDRVYYALCAICVALFLADFAYEKHGHFDFEDSPGFYAAFGFLAYVGLVLTATQLRKVLRRDEDYYD